MQPSYGNPGFNRVLIASILEAIHKIYLSMSASKTSLLNYELLGAYTAFADWLEIKVDELLFAIIFPIFKNGISTNL